MLSAGVGGRVWKYTMWKWECYSVCGKRQEPAKIPPHVCCMPELWLKSPNLKSRTSTFRTNLGKLIEFAGLSACRKCARFHNLAMFGDSPHFSWGHTLAVIGSTFIFHPHHLSVMLCDTDQLHLLLPSVIADSLELCATPVKSSLVMEIITLSNLKILLHSCCRKDSHMVLCFFFPHCTLLNEGSGFNSFPVVILATFGSAESNWKMFAKTFGVPELPHGTFPTHSSPLCATLTSMLLFTWRGTRGQPREDV